MPCQYFHRGNGLDGLAQSHLVADQRAAGPHREQRALGLIGIERHLQQGPQPRIGGAARKQLLELRGPTVRVPPSRDKIEGIVIGTQLVTAVARHGHELLELAQPLLGQHPVAFDIEQGGGGLAHRRRTIRSGAKMHAAPAVIAQVQLGKRRLVAARERPPRAALFHQPGQCEFEVLAGAQLAGGIIGARTEVAAGPQAANRHPVTGFRNRIADPELGKERFAGQIFEAEGLLASELPS